MARPRNSSLLIGCAGFRPIQLINRRRRARDLFRKFSSCKTDALYARWHPSHKKRYHAPTTAGLVSRAQVGAGASCCACVVFFLRCASIICGRLFFFSFMIPTSRIRLGTLGHFFAPAIAHTLHQGRPPHERRCVATGHLKGNHV